MGKAGSQSGKEANSEQARKPEKNDQCQCVSLFPSGLPLHPLSPASDRIYHLQSPGRNRSDDPGGRASGDYQRAFPGIYGGNDSPFLSIQSGKPRVPEAVPPKLPEIGKNGSCGAG